MFSMIDSGIRGGVAMISTRYAQANEPSMGAQYDASKPTISLRGFDANNLYGAAMSEPLPDGKFEWVDRAELDNIKWLEQEVDQDFGYIVMVDLDYPAELHEAHNDLPLAPERLQVKESYLSATQVNIRAQYDNIRNDLQAKLIPNLMNKKRYVLHYRNLRFYLEHGLILKHVHQAIKFHQSRWMKNYVKLNQDNRILAQNEVEQEFFKLMNNSLFGKTCENQKKRTQIKLVNDRQKFQDLVNKPNFMDCRRFTDNLAAVEMQKTSLKINKPSYVGFVVLELSKLIMYQ